MLTNKRKDVEVLKIEKGQSCTIVHSLGVIVLIGCRPLARSRPPRVRTAHGQPRLRRGEPRSERSGTAVRTGLSDTDTPEASGGDERTTTYRCRSSSRVPARSPLRRVRAVAAADAGAVAARRRRKSAAASATSPATVALAAARPPPLRPLPGRRERRATRTTGGAGRRRAIRTRRAATPRARRRLRPPDAPASSTRARRPGAAAHRFLHVQGDGVVVTGCRSYALEAKLRSSRTC